ncbi:hypothetical protein KPH14_010094 [Odynerus spinipes]|uniref:Uncharacterized protein n=1 Tax=Odynerus spinipes TaxID=1348599 RepID=A0AAD9RT25_9HYME|nr:hypothetical protein KPH14_010094 [Odynerus spinipes]
MTVATGAEGGSPHGPGPASQPSWFCLLVTACVKKVSLKKRERQRGQEITEDPILGEDFQESISFRSANESCRDYELGW